MKQKIKAGFRGDSVGEPFVSSAPWKWTPFNWSPAQLSIDKIQQWPQGIVCALLATPAIVALLPTGEAPTYENLDASMRWWWDNTIIPLEDSFADDIETQLFPAFGLNNTDWRIGWDRSQVPALQEDQTQKHTMICADFKAGVIDRDEARVALGYESKGEYKGVFHPSATAGDPQAEPVSPEEAAQQERLNGAAKIVDDNGMSHGPDGKFDGGTGSGLSSRISRELAGTATRIGDWKGSLDEFTQQFSGAKIEHAVLYTASGNQLVHLIGDEHEIYIPSAFDPYMKDGVLVHNHPPPPITALSNLDLGYLYRGNPKRLSMVTRLDTEFACVTIERKGAEWGLPPEEEMHQEYFDLVDKTKATFSQDMLKEARAGNEERAIRHLKNGTYGITFKVVEDLSKKYGTFSIREEVKR